jgi:hypothetical protein
MPTLLITDPIQPASLANSCRLCGNQVAAVFSLRLLQKYEVEYLRCIVCESLQTERPYWMQEAYQNNLSILDTGAAQRNLSNLAATFAVSKLLHLSDVVDFGGGDGLLCRLLRDYKINCYVNDKYAAASYARAFATPEFFHPGILLAFEVLEHFECPFNDLKPLFASNPRVILASTGIYCGQGSDWWYLAPETGQHVFFYSEKALHSIAKSYGYRLLICSGHLLFLKSDLTGMVKTFLVKLLLQRYVLRMISAAMRLLPTRGVQSDFDALRSNRKDFDS